ncbi:MAG TPA: shikimate dehydrogenase [Fibrobacteria bacterium]|nr:shikimate dehydrogenase [Fibrobacteria bacterium]
MKKLYLLGHPVSHSLSPIMQNAAIQHYGLDWEYSVLDVAPENLIATLEELEADPDVIGCNVTVPHKVAVYEWLKSRSRHLAAEGEYAEAVNTLVKRSERFDGDSTDFRGAMAALKQTAPVADLSKLDVAVLGTGGSAQSMIAGFDQEFRVRSVTAFGRNLRRFPEITERTNYKIPLLPLTDFPEWNNGRRSLVVQTTTVGLDSGDDPGQSPVPSGSVKSGQIAFDLVYKPHDTPFLIDAAKNGATVVHGIGMLVGQGAFALQQWTQASTGRIIDISETMSVMRSALGV